MSLEPSRWIRRATDRRWRTRVVFVLCLALSVPSGPTVPAWGAEPDPLGRTALPQRQGVKVSEPDRGTPEALKQVQRQRAANTEQAERARAQQHATWPAGGTGTLAVSPAGQARTVGGLPVRFTASGEQAATGDVRIAVADQPATKAAGVRGVIFSAMGTGPGSSTVTVDYRAFASAYGGDWAGRLRLFRLPACALTTPGRSECRARKELPTRHDVDAQTLSAPVELGGGTGPETVAVLAVAAAAAGQSAKGSGTYEASELSPSATWQAGGSSGAFTWSYPMDAPAATAGPGPALGLSYDSGGIDGRTANTNNQGSQVGEGFSLSAHSYVERRYQSCDDDGHADKFDSCWKYENASLVLDGMATELVKDDATGKWRLKDDDASKVELLTDTALGNGDDNGEYWRVTTGDGTRYTFGRHELPGWSDHGDAADDPVTNSVWTVPVFGDDSGEPGYSSGTSFADRWKRQAWRWNLDLVEDSHGNSMSYWYARENNYYRKNDASTADTYYTRGGTLTEIRYGQRPGGLFATPPHKVTFGYAERCTATDCGSLTEATAEKWPDVPFDTICDSGDSSTDCLATSPSFFTRKRLTNVNTFSLVGSTLTAVDSWTLAHQYLDGGDIGDSSDQSLTLSSITRIGKSGTAITLDPVSFTYRMLENRVDTNSDDILPLNRPRIDTVTSETGAITTVSYSPESDCLRGSKMPVAEDNNADSALACYPVYWHINGGEEAGLDWFHKYRVTAVTMTDPENNNEPVEYAYSYTGPGWHYDDSPFTPADERTWSIWRGYRQVTAFVGAAGGTRNKTVSLYLQGMDGDRKKDGTKRDVSVPGIGVTGLAVPAVEDLDQYAGFTRQQITYNGSTAIAVTVDDPWWAKTATQHKSYADTEAYYVRSTKTTSHTYLTVPGTWRTTATTTSYDSFGMVAKIDAAGDTAKSGDETCTSTWYARNDDPNAGIYFASLVSRARTVGQPCGKTDAELSLPATAAGGGDVLADTAVVYDSATATGWRAAQSPTKGDATWAGRATAYPATADAAGSRHPSSWQKTSSTSFDVLGRPTAVKDAAERTTTTVYTPAGAGPLTKTYTTSPGPQSLKTAIFFDGRRGSPEKVYDTNSKLTEIAYDALGRTTGVWQPNRSRAANQSANTTYSYSMGRGAEPYIKTSALTADNSGNPTYITGYQIFDALLRPLQTQAPTPTGGRLLTDTRYDSRGLAYETHAGIYDTEKTPEGTYVRAAYGGAPEQHNLTFDGAGRLSTDTFLVKGVAKWSTSAGYTGDSVAVTAPAGGQGVRTITDALGRTVERREYAAPTVNDTAFGGTAPAPPYASVKHTYTRDGKQSTITGPDGKQWSYGYDLFGRQTTATDPDKGTTTTGYTTLDQIDWVTDATGKKLLYGYDEQGRQTGMWQSSKTDANKLAAWTYDTAVFAATTTPAKGQLASATRYDGGTAGRAYTRAITEYDTLYRATRSELRLDANDPLVASGIAQATYTFQGSYNLDGTLQKNYEPAVGGLPAEWIDYSYTPTGEIERIQGATGYLLDTAYTELGQPYQQVLGTSDTGVKKAYLNHRYETGTGRLTQSFVTDDTHPWMLQDLNYSYDQAGNVTRIADPATLGGTAQPDYQCFAHDGFRRLTEAKTPATDDCASTTLGGAAPYRSVYTYNTGGQRTSETKHSGSTATTTTYCYTKPEQPHTLRHTNTTGDCANIGAWYNYDAAGNTTQRPGKSAAQILTWNSEGQLATATEGALRTGYLYDADGELLIRRATGDGETVLYLGSTELHHKTVGTTTKTWATRDYAGIAIRSNETGASKLTWLAADHHGTSGLALDSATQAVTKRYTTPFGAPRGTNPTWPDDKRFLGKTADTETGLTHVDAREYDAAIGQFISVDPLLEIDIAQTLNGYSYGANSPATFSDPTGMGLACKENGVRGAESCGNGNVTHADGSKSYRDKNGTVHATGGGVMAPPEPDITVIGAGAVIVLSDSPIRDDLIAAYNDERNDFKRPDGWSDIEYDLAIWSSICQDGDNFDICGIGEGSLSFEMAMNYDEVVNLGQSPDSPSVGTLVLGLDPDVAESTAVESSAAGGLSMVAAAMAAIERMSKKYPGKGTIAKKGSISVVMHTRDHPPIHAHVKQGSHNVRIGQNGAPLAGEPELTRAQQRFVQDNLQTIQRNIRAAKTRLRMMKYGPNSPRSPGRGAQQQRR